MDIKRIREILEKRTSINSNTGCWEYLGVNSDGYGQVTIDFIFYYVHRLSAQLFLDYIPSDVLFVLHRCNNKCCWNPEHLYIGTDTENTQDKIQVGNARGKYSDVTHCIHGHEFTEENTYTTRRGNGNMRRQCRECRKIRDKEYKGRNKIVSTFREVG